MQIGGAKGTQWKLGGTMMVVFFLTEHTVADGIIGHLKLTFTAERKMKFLPFLDKYVTFF
ncbi:MAG: hypothetical protein WCC06_01045 [Candidatus Aminicenantales bacterium]